MPFVVYSLQVPGPFGWKYVMIRSWQCGIDVAAVGIHLGHGSTTPGTRKCVRAVSSGREWYGKSCHAKFWNRILTVLTRTVSESSCKPGPFGGVNLMDMDMCLHALSSHTCIGVYIYIYIFT